MERIGLLRHLNVWLGLVVAAVLVAPVALDRDGFPLSTYPMYSRTRGAVVALPTAYGLDDAGAEHRLSLGTIGDSDDPLIVAGELRAALSGGRAELRCTQIAARVDDPTIRRVVVVVERHEVVERTLDRPSLVDRTVHAECPTGEDLGP